MRGDDLLVKGLLMTRRYVYGVLFKLLSGSPNQELLEALLCDETVEAVDQYAEEAPMTQRFRDMLKGYRELSEPGRKGLLDAMVGEYTRTFVGPETLPAQPFESFYRTHEPTLFQMNTLAVRRAYAAENLRARKVNHIPDDHVALECAFMAEMSARANDLLAQGDRRGFALSLRSQASFAKEHLCGWLSQYASLLARRSRSNAMYGPAIAFFAEFVEADLRFMYNALAWLDEGDTARGDEVSAEQLAAFEAAEARLRAAFGRVSEVDVFGHEDVELVAA